MRRSTTTAALALLAWMTIPAAGAAPVEFTSGKDRAQVIELYTSEGCSSCPPAERHLNAYAQRPDLWRRYVPLAFHVDYWDYLGWKDRFAQPEFDQRQRHYVRLGRLSGVYTPAFVLNGRAWRPGVFGRIPQRDSTPAGVLHVTVDGRQIHATVQNSGSLPNHLTLHVAVLGMGLTSHIQAGENAGREARHEFVVLAHQKVTGTDGQWDTRLPDLTDQAPRLALAAWLTTPGDPTPLQATGGYLPR
jgi:hypothetical protein